MRKALMVLALLVSASLVTACPAKEEAKPTEPDKAADNKAEDKAEPDKKDDADKAEAEKKDEAKPADEKKDEEPAKVAQKPGQIPFEYPIVETTAVAGEYVLCPSKTWIDQAFEKGGDKQTFIFYTAKMVEPGKEESKVKTLSGKDEVIPNAMIIPIKKGQEAAPGDILLTWWQTGSGMKRAIVTGGTKTEPKVRYLDVKLENPSGLGTREDTLKPDSFHKLSKEWDLGTAVAVKNGTRHDHALIVNIAGDKVLTIGFAGKMKVVAKADITPVPVTVDVKKGDKVYFPFIGAFREGTVSKIDKKIGRVFVGFKFGGQDKEEAAAMGNVLTSLEGAAAAPVVEKVEPAKDDAKKDAVVDAKFVMDGTYQGKLIGSKSNGKITVSIKGAKLSGNVKGTYNGEKFLTGFSGSAAKGKVQGLGANKKTNLRLTGVGNAKNVTGTLTGKVNDKPAVIKFVATH